MSNIKHKLTSLVFAIVAVSLLTTFIVPRVSAFPVNCPDGSTQDASSADAADHVCDNHQAGATSSGGDCASRTSQSVATSQCSGDIVSNPCQGKDYCDFVNKYVNPAMNFLAVGFGLIVTIMIVASGIQYITSAGDPQKVNAAKKRIFNAVGALLLFIFMYALLQWIVPGGLF